MMMLIEPESERLPLRQWLPADLLTFVAMSSDEAAMACFPALLTRVDGDALALRWQHRITVHGYRLWAQNVRTQAS